MVAIEAIRPSTLKYRYEGSDAVAVAVLPAGSPSFICGCRPDCVIAPCWEETESTGPRSAAGHCLEKLPPTARSQMWHTMRCYDPHLFPFRLAKLRSRGLSAVGD